MPQTIRVAHSPDSDDAFMFYGLFYGAVKAEGLAFEQRDRRHRVAQPGGAPGDATTSPPSRSHAYAHLHDKYVLLDAGASFGDGYGPTVIVSPTSQFRRLEELGRARIAVPGRVDQRRTWRSACASPASTRCSSTSRTWDGW